MADLIDRLSGKNLGGRPKLPIHQFVALVRLYAAGLVTKEEVVADWDLQGEELTQASALAGVIDGKVGAAKMLYALTVDAVCLLLERDDDRVIHNSDGTVNRDKIKTLLEIS